MESINSKLRQLRKERGLTLSDLAEKMGTDHQHISRIERGKSKLTVDFLVKLANALDTPVEGIMDPIIKKDFREGVKEDLPPRKTSTSSTNMNLLATILEKIETVSTTQKIPLSSREKAFLASEIYNHSLKAAAWKDPEQIQNALIDCSIALMEYIYESLSTGLKKQVT